MKINSITLNKIQPYIFVQNRNKVNFTSKQRDVFVSSSNSQKYDEDKQMFFYKINKIFEKQGKNINYFGKEKIDKTIKQLDKNNFKDYLDYLKSNEVIDAFNSTEYYVNPKTNLFDISLYRLHQKYKDSIMSNFHLKGFLSSSVDMSSGKISPLANNFIDIVLNGKKHQIFPVKTNILKKINTSNGLTLGTTETITACLKSMKDINGDIKQENYDYALKMLEQSSIKDGGITNFLNCFKPMKNEKGIITQDSYELYCRILNETKSLQLTASILSSFKLCEKKFKTDIFDILYEIFPNRKSLSKNFSIALDECFYTKENEDGKYNQYLDKENLEFLKTFTDTNPYVRFNPHFWQSYKEHDEKEFMLELTKLAKNDRDIENISQITDYLVEISPDSKINQNAKKELINCFKEGYALEYFNSEHLLNFLNDDKNFDKKKFEFIKEIIKISKKLNRSLAMNLEYYINILLEENITRCSFYQKQTALNFFSAINEKYLNKITDKKALFDIINDLSFRLGENVVCIDVDESVKNSFIENILKSNDKGEDLTDFEKSIVNSIGYLKSCKNGIALSYTRDKFINDLNTLLDDKKQVQKKLTITPIIEDGKITGFDGTLIPNAHNSHNSNNNKLYETVNKFLNNNAATPDKKLNKYLDILIKTFPEFISIIGKKQHENQNYTLDIHSLLTLANAINDPQYKTLSSQDKSTLKLCAIFHDIAKKEGMIDKEHPINSAVLAGNITKKIIKNNGDKDRIFRIIQHHNFLEEISRANNIENKAQEIAFLFRYKDDFKIAKILTLADLKSISGYIYNLFSPELDGKNVKKIEEYIKEANSSGVSIQTNKIVNPQKLQNHLKKIGNRYFKVIDFNTLEPNEDLEEYGFEKGTTKNNVRFLVHMVSNYTASQSLENVINLSKPMNEGVLSESIISPKYNATYSDRKIGVILSGLNSNIIAMSKSGISSGERKVLTESLEFLYGSKIPNKKYVSRFKDMANPEMTNDDYENFYSNTLVDITSLSQINDDKKYEVGNKNISGKQLKKILKALQDEYISYFDNNEIVTYIPKVEAILIKAKNLDELDKNLLDFIYQNDYTIILI